MDKHTIIKSVFLGMFACVITACGDMGLDVNGNSGSQTYTETNEEAMVTAAVESLTSSISSSESASASSYASLTKGPAYLTVGNPINTSYATLAKRFRCEELSSVNEVFSCDNATGAMTREVSFEDCDLIDSNKPGTLSGGFTNTVENGGSGLCDGLDHIDFAKMVMGRDGLNAVHTHTIDDGGMVFTLDVSDTVTITMSGNDVVTFTDPVDEDVDGVAESVTATVVKDINRVTVENGVEVHNVTVSTREESFTPTDEEGTLLEIVNLNYPVHNLVFDETDKVETRTVTSGELVIDRSHSDLRIVLGVGAEGLTFYPQDHCGPFEGTATITGYVLNEEGNYVEAGSGQIVYADGEVQTAEYNGIELNLKPRPCS
ncbi:MAG TPA: hypothetical protein VJC18_03550 [bacterium]|nr:hypothetical protein [bacterium]